MQRLKAMVHLQTIAGQPVTVGHDTITPQAQVLTLRTPIGGFVWNRPVAVLVERAERIERHRIRDITRILQLGMPGVLVSIILITRFFQRRRPIS